MQWLNLIPEHANLQRIRADWRRSPGLSAPLAVTPARPATPAGRDAGYPAPRYSGRERRRGERRHRQLPVLLDTRSQDDRRHADTGAMAGAVGKHINLYA